jgi:hypothetical protein
VHNLFLVYFVNFIYNLYIFRISPRPSSGGTTVFLRHLVLVILKLVDSLKFLLYSSIKMLQYSGINVKICIFLCVIRDLVSKGKAVPLKAWSGPEGSTTTTQDGGKIVSLTHRPPLAPGNTAGTHFC